MRYENILFMKRPSSGKHISMSMRNRAAQFAPFAALTGLDDEIKEASRLTCGRLDISEDRAAELDMKTRLLTEFASVQPEITVEYFIPDEKKEGGRYMRLTDRFRWLDGCSGELVMCGGERVSVADIYSIAGEIFSSTASGQG